MDYPIKSMKPVLRMFNFWKNVECARLFAWKIAINLSFKPSCGCHKNCHFALNFLPFFLEKMAFCEKSFFSENNYENIPIYENDEIELKSIQNRIPPIPRSPIPKKPCNVTEENYEIPTFLPTYTEVSFAIPQQKLELPNKVLTFLKRYLTKKKKIKSFQHFMYSDIIMVNSKGTSIKTMKSSEQKYAPDSPRQQVREKLANRIIFLLWALHLLKIHCKKGFATKNLILGAAITYKLQITISHKM